MTKLDQTFEERLAARTALLEQALRGQAELLAEVRRAHALLASTFNAIGDAIVVADATGRITQANSAVSHLFNRGPEDVIGDTCHSLLAEGLVCPHAFTPEFEGGLALNWHGSAMLRVLVIDGEMARDLLTTNMSRTARRCGRPRNQRFPSRDSCCAGVGS